MPEPPQFTCRIPLDRQSSPRRARFGLEVAAKLARTQEAEKLLAKNAILYRVPGFLDAQLCRRLVRQIDADCGPTLEYKAAGFDGHRTSQTCLFKPHLRDPAEVEARIDALLGLPRSHAEPIQGQRYRPGQRFGVHGDFFFIDQPYWRDYGRRGGQRTWTAMIFLNEPEEGGATRFPYAEVEVAPERGTMLVWNNMTGNGCPNPWTMHEGTPVGAGTKYILTLWYRERPWM